MSLESIFEKKFREAQERGDFDGLPTTGAFDLSGDDSVPPEERLALHLLRENGYAPAWIEEDNGLRAQLEGLRAFLARAVARRARSRAQSLDLAARAAADEEWRRARAEFEAMVARFNREIFLFNLRAPSLALQRMPLRASEEYAAVGVD